MGDGRTYLLANALDEFVGKHIGRNVIGHKLDQTLKKNRVIGKIVESVLHPFLQYV